MKIKYKHIHFEECPGPVAKHPLYYCKNNRDGCILGRIFYYITWKKYVFEGGDGCVFDTFCLADIIHFLNQL